MLIPTNELFALIGMYAKSGKEIDCAPAKVGNVLKVTGNPLFGESAITYEDVKFLNYRLKKTVKDEFLVT